MTENGLIIHGHRGSRGTHPENTLPSFAEARDAGVPFVELDVHLTKDGHAVVYHDFEITGKLCRDSNGNPVEEKLLISELTLAEIKSFECGSLLQKSYPEQIACPGEKIPTLDELMQWKLQHAPRMNLNIEIKRAAEQFPFSPSAEKMAQAVMQLLHKHALLEESIVQSFDHSVVRALRKLDSSLKLSCLFEHDADFTKVALEHEAQFAAPHFRLVDEEKVARAQEAGIEILPWTVNQVDDWERLIGYGVRSIITDYPRKLAEFAVLTVE